MWLTETADFVPRAVCGAWPPWMVWCYVGADVGLGLAYTAIPVTLFVFWRHKRRAIPYPSLQLLFAAFIVLCGLTHWLDALMFFWPAYRLTAAVMVIASLVSLATAVVFVPVVRWTLALKTPSEYFELLQRIEADLHRERDVGKRLDILIAGLEARQSWLRSHVDGGSVTEDAVRCDQIVPLLEQARAARRMVAAHGEKA